MTEQDNGRVVFISVTQKDEYLGRRLGARLREAGIKVWVYYQDIRGGCNVVKFINEGLEKSAIQLVIWTKAAYTSDWIELEWTTFVMSKKPIIPCLFDETPLPHILRSRAFIEFFDFEKGIDELFRALGLQKESTALM